MSNALMVNGVLLISMLCRLLSCTRSVQLQEGTKTSLCIAASAIVEGGKREKWKLMQEKYLRRCVALWIRAYSLQNRLGYYYSQSIEFICGCAGSRSPGKLLLDLMRKLFCLLSLNRALSPLLRTLENKYTPCFFVLSYSMLESMS